MAFGRRVFRQSFFMENELIFISAADIICLNISLYDITPNDTNKVRNVYCQKVRSTSR